MSALLNPAMQSIIILTSHQYKIIKARQYLSFKMNYSNFRVYFTCPAHWFELDTFQMLNSNDDLSLPSWSVKAQLQKQKNIDKMIFMTPFNLVFTFFY